MKTDKVRDFLGALAVSRSGVDFGSEEPAVHVVFLFLSPRSAVSGHLRLLAQIGGILRHESYVTLLRDAKSRDELVALVKGAERTLFGEGGPDRDRDRVPAL